MILKDVKAIFSEFDAYGEALDRNGCISYPVTITWTEMGPGLAFLKRLKDGFRDDHPINRPMTRFHSPQPDHASHLEIYYPVLFLPGYE